MLFIFSTPVLIKHLRQLKTIVFPRWCLICAILMLSQNGISVITFGLLGLRDKIRYGHITQESQDK